MIGCIVAIKPNFAAWPAVLLLAGHLRAPLTAFVVAAILSTIPLLTHGSAIYTQWAGVILADESRTAFLTNASIPGLAARVGVPAAGMIAAVAVLAIVAAWAFRSKPSPLEASAIGMVAAIAASPIAWVHYTLLLLPVFFRWTRSTWLLPAAMLLVVPVPVVLRFLDAPLWQQGTIGSVYNWAVILCLVRYRPSAGVPGVPVGSRGFQRVLEGSRGFQGVPGSSPPSSLSPQSPQSRHRVR